MHFIGLERERMSCIQACTLDTSSKLPADRIDIFRGSESKIISITAAFGKRISLAISTKPPDQTSKHSQFSANTSRISGLCHCPKSGRMCWVFRKIILKLAGYTAETKGAFPLAKDE
jgi:hypothetical protein